ncbi:putative group 1 glycosyl transferase [Magnetofaba australis IT-1]|uniref:Putative group 1 glycosyl transferase n=1 Tax=Magnetofaba australis IT-1 TaxID=1434232 RepID=A0A1Y2K292_9PROT|nr:putative group 1 glycosyl transferase [Magnetofaba australis IT-1]
MSPHTPPADAPPQGFAPRRILIATDAWDPPQVNGVALTYAETIAQLRAWGDTVEAIHPRLFPGKWWTIKADNVELVRDGGLTARLIDQFAPDHVHIATEGPIGFAAWRHCRKRGLAFTTTYHTQWPEYAERRSQGLVSARWLYPLVRAFHNAAAQVMAPTPAMADLLADNGFTSPVRLWARGVDQSLFHPRPQPQERPEELRNVAGPVALYVGRVASEKSIEAFLEADSDAQRCVVGEGPLLSTLRRKFPRALFVGLKRGEALARFYAAADLFVFPSRTDTFGRVMIEALASGAPVAAFPVDAPRFVLGDSGAGAMHEDLGRAMAQALTIEKDLCLKRAACFTIADATRQFRAGLVDVEA